MANPPSESSVPQIHLSRWPVFQKPLPAYAAALGVTLLALLLRWQFDPAMGNTCRLGFFMAATGISAFLFGSGPGYFSTALGLLLADYFFIEPRHSIGIHSPAQALLIAASVVQGAGISWCAGQLHRALRSREEAEEEALALYEEKCRAHDAAEELNRTKDYFLAVLSHELRGPLSAISCCVAGRINDHEISEDLREDFALIDRSARMQARLISDLLDLTRLTRGKMEIECRPLDIHPLLTEAIRTSSNASQTAGGPIPTLRLHAHDTWIQGDRDRLLQILWNILRNAGKFTPRDGRIDVETFETKPGHIAIRVRDTGIGLDREAFARIFEPFEQAARVADRKQGGLGLGLAIARGLVELHHGTLVGESDGPGKGTSFTIEFPTINRHQPPPNSRRSGSTRARPTSRRAVRTPAPSPIT